MLRRSVALKVLPPDLVADPEHRRRFVREAQAAAAVSHPAVAAIYEVGEERGEVFIAMEYVDGRTLRAVLDEGQQSVSEALRIAAEVARGLEEAHAAGVIHRDLKPENLILTPQGRVKILDFGLAKLRQERGPAAATGSSQAQTHQAAANARRDDPRHRGLHVAGTGAGPGRRPPLRPLLPRRAALRDGGGPESLPRPHLHRFVELHPRGRAPRRIVVEPRGPRLPGPPARVAAGQGPRRLPHPRRKSWKTSAACRWRAPASRSPFSRSPT